MSLLQINKLCLLIASTVFISLSVTGQNKPDKKYAEEHINRIIRQLSSASDNYNKRKYEAAVTYIDSIIYDLYQTPVPYYDKIYLQKLDSALVLSVQLMDNIIRVAPTSFNYAVRGKLYGIRGDTEGAIKDLSAAIEAEPGNHEYLYNRGTILMRISQNTRALSDYNKCLQINPDYGPAYINRGYLYIDLKMYNEAMRDFHTALKFCKSTVDSSFTLNNIGYVYYLNKSYNNALSNINRSLKLNSLNPFAFKNKALVEIELGHPDIACQDLKTAIRLGFRESYGSEVDELLDKHCKK